MRGTVEFIVGESCVLDVFVEKCLSVDSQLGLLSIGRIVSA